MRHILCQNLCFQEQMLWVPRKSFFKTVKFFNLCWQKYVLVLFPLLKYRDTSATRRLDFTNFYYCRPGNADITLIFAPWRLRRSVEYKSCLHWLVTGGINRWFINDRKCLTYSRSLYLIPVIALMSIMVAYSFVTGSVRRHTTLK